MKNAALSQLTNLQRALYEKAFSEANAMRVSASLKSYAARYEDGLPSVFERCEARDVIDAANERRVVLFGDFHTLRQSQRGFMRLIRDYRQRYPRRPVIIAMELFRTSDQAHVDAWLKGRLNDKEFLDKIRYVEEWGFPWRNYRMVLDLARRDDLSVVGINTDRAGRDQLARRDRFAADRLADIAAANPEALIFVLIGEYHLADPHLPKSLRDESRRRKTDLKPLRVLCNVDRYYFALHRDGETNLESTEHLRFRDDLYCLLNSPPWIKWQTYTLWEENRSVQEISDEEAPEEGGDGFDVDYHFLNLVRTLTDFLGLKSDHIELGRFRVRISNEADFAESLDSAGIESEAKAERVIARASRDGQFVIPQRGIVLFTDPSINNMAEAAGQYLLGVLGAFEDSRAGQPIENFYRRIIKVAVGMTASKIINPGRKGPSEAKFRAFLRTVSKRRLAGVSKRAKTTAEAIIRHSDWMNNRIENHHRRFGGFPKSIVALDKKLDYEISTQIGRILGLALYDEALRDPIASDFVRLLFMSSVPEFDSLWVRVATLWELVDPSRASR